VLRDQQPLNMTSHRGGLPDGGRDEPANHDVLLRCFDTDFTDFHKYI